MEKILFVCTGNTCRSPMAAAFTNDFLKKEKISHLYTAVSAGISAYSGEFATENTLSVMKEAGVLVNNHRSSRLEPALVEEASMVFVMTNQHKNLLDDAFPDLSHKIFILGNGVPDPYGYDNNKYKETRDIIEGHTRNIVKKLKSDLDNTGI